MKPIEIDLKPPRWFDLGLMLMHVLALLVVAFTALNQAIPWWAAALLFVAVLVSMGTRQLHARSARFDELKVNSNGVLTLYRQGEWQ